MLIKFGPGILDARGSIGGVTVSRNASGAYMRARVKPVNPNTERQDDVRSAMAYLADRWAQTLTALAREAWEDYAASVSMKNKLGESIFNSGFNHYMRSNIIRKLRNSPVKDNGPVDFTLPAQDPTLSFTASQATQVFTIAYDDGMQWDNETDGYLYLFQGRPQNAQRNRFFGPWRFLGQVDGATGAPVATPLLADAVFAISETQRQWIYGRISMADGRLSEPFRANEFIGA